MSPRVYRNLDEIFAGEYEGLLLGMPLLTNHFFLNARLIYLSTKVPAFMSAVLILTTVLNQRLFESEIHVLPK